MAELNIAELPIISVNDFTANDRFLIVDDGKARLLTKTTFEEWLSLNIQGVKGEQGVAGKDGLKGKDGKDGTNGTDGISAYQIAKLNGFVGTEVQWLASMKGTTGAKGLDGGNGWTPVIKSTAYADGYALEVTDWVGGTGTKPTSLGYVSETGLVSNIANATNVRGVAGATGKQGIQGVQGIQGIKGEQGFKGDTGLSSYELAVAGGFVGTVEEYLASLNPSEVSKEPNNIITKKADGMFALATDPLEMATAIDLLPNKNILTDAQKDKLEGLKTSKYLGTYLTSGAIPTVGAVAGNYADVDSGEPNVNTERWIYDVQLGAFVKSVSIPAIETAESVKTKYESNTNTNAFTDSEKSKLDTLTLETATTIKTKYESNTDTNAFTDAEKTKLASVKELTNLEIKTKYESNTNTNAFTDTEKTKLSTLEKDPIVTRVLDVNTSTGLKFWTGTQSQYTAITPKDPNTLYIVKT